MGNFANSLAREPAALGTLVASVLPALVALQVVSVNEQTIGVLVVAVNAIIGFFVRMVVEPAIPATNVPQPDAVHG